MRPQNLSTEEIALVNVPYGLNGERSMRPLGLAYLGAFLEAHDITAKGFDFSDCSQPLEDLVHRYHLFRFPVVGLSFYNIIPFDISCFTMVDLWLGSPLHTLAIN
jgi:hypothetical protein